MPMLLINLLFFAIIVFLLDQLALEEEERMRCWEKLQKVEAHRDSLLFSQASEEVLNLDVEVAERARAGKVE